MGVAPRVQELASVGDFQEATGGWLEPIEIKPELQRLFRRYDGKITEPDLTEWATLISDRIPLQRRSGKMRW